MTKRPRLPGLAFSLIDVFADEPLTGNPLAVVADAEGLDEATMGRIAREFNQSETTFLLPPTRKEAFVRLRSFTPTGVEVFGAGHNALGAWWWLAHGGKLGDVANGVTLMQEIGTRILPVEIVANGGRVAAISMTQATPEFLAVHEDQGALAAALGVRAEELGIDGLRPQVVSTGAAHLLVPARRRSVVEGARPEAALLAAQLRAVAAQGCYLFSLDPIDGRAAAHARFFNPTVGIWEDPATGSAAGPLAAQLVARGKAKDGDEMIVEQGYAVGRPSRIQVRVEGANIQVRGRCVVVAEGTLRLDAKR